MAVAGVVYEHIALVDTSAVLALNDPKDRFHAAASEFLHNTSLTLVTLNVTAHEAYTRGRYDHGLTRGRAHYEFLRSSHLGRIYFTEFDEADAYQMLLKYTDQRLSFHDALCGAVMLREGIYKVFAFDSDFFTFGFELVPGDYA